MGVVHKSLRIIGVSHVDPDGLNRIQHEIRESKPSVVALELCPQRLAALKNIEKGYGRSGLAFPIGGIIGLLIALLEKTAGERTGVLPGSEMLTAIKEAENIKATVEPIDQPILITLQKLSTIPFWEKVKFTTDAIKTLLSLVLASKNEVTKINTTEILKGFKTRYPNLHRILVEERNAYMTKRLKNILQQAKGLVVAIIGLGHLTGITEIMAKEGFPIEIPPDPS
ncbi:TraB/GumN family protein [Candidatus Bathyarchaeota archaeon]|nr:TraB/GumN family protein [Candidatus Bathyarchaeota archaeon]